MRLYIMALLFALIISCSNSIIPSDSTLGICIDGDGNVYKTVVIGDQIWMAENLKTTRFKDGTLIPLVEDSSAWCSLVSAGYCWHNNDPLANKDVYGALYNWYAVNTGKLAPKGWHVATYAEWNTLVTYLGGWNVAGGKLRDTGTTHWLAPNDGATNETGFSALPGDYRSEFGAFGDIGNYGNWWSSTEFDSVNAWCRNVNNFNTSIYRFNPRKGNGFSVRCVQDVFDRR